MLSDCYSLSMRHEAPYTLVHCAMTFWCIYPSFLALHICFSMHGEGTWNMHVLQYIDTDRNDGHLLNNYYLATMVAQVFGMPLFII